MEKKILVCVTQQKTCERLILKGYELIDQESDHLTVLHVVKQGAHFLEYSSDAQALEYLFEVSKEVGAELTVKRSKHVLDDMVKYAKEEQVTHMILGASPSQQTQEKSFAIRLQDRLPEVNLIVMD
ncbi:hypothetical protein SANA_12840 [Gottschalkiaceae bacterium SANA]|nr:hypothetical protein SANA_12840 [Gottschalkiaceae bacterium SANA]